MQGLGLEVSVPRPLTRAATACVSGLLPLSGAGGTRKGKAAPSCAGGWKRATEAETSMERSRERGRTRDRETERGPKGSLEAGGQGERETESQAETERPRVSKRQGQRESTEMETEEW